MIRNDPRRIVCSGIALVFIFLTMGCMIPETRVKIEKPVAINKDLAGLMFVEKTYLDINGKDRLGVVNLNDTTSTYYGRLVPGGDSIEFRKIAAGIHVAWVPSWKLKQPGRTTIMLTAREVTNGYYRFDDEWPENHPGLSAVSSVEVGRVTYLGILRHIIEITIDNHDFSENGETIISAGAAESNHHIQFVSDPGNEAVSSLCLDNPWLMNALLNPPEIGRAKTDGN